MFKWEDSTSDQKKAANNPKLKTLFFVAFQFWVVCYLGANNRNQKHFLLPFVSHFPFHLPGFVASLLPPDSEVGAKCSSAGFPAALIMETIEKISYAFMQGGPPYHL